MRLARSSAIAIAALLAGCQSCGGDRGTGAAVPAVAAGSGSAIEAPGAAAGSAIVGSPEVARAAGYLDAPPGTLDGFFAGLAAAQNGDPSGRALVLFFGDSHTAGDSLTERLRVT